MIIDMHLHQRLNSSDSQLELFEAIEIAKSRGLDGICITDHDDLGLRSMAETISIETGFKVFVGVEIYTLDGDLLCFGIDKLPEERMSAQATIDYVNAKGGITIAAHPYRHNNRGLGDTIADVKGLGAIEAYNGRTDDFSNLKALKLAEMLNMPITGGSDSHTDFEVGSFATEFTVPVQNEIELISAIRNGFVEPVTMTGREMKRLETA